MFGTLNILNLIDGDHSTCLTLPQVTGSDIIQGHPMIFTVGVFRGFSGQVLVFLNTKEHICNVTNIDVVISVATGDQPQGKFIEGCSIVSITNGTELSSCVFLCDIQKISSNELNAVNFFLLDKRSSVADTIDVCDINVVYLLEP